MSELCQASRHGTASAYKHARCRCPKAREAMRVYWRVRYLPGERPAGKYRPNDIDEIAVERAMYGDRVRLSVPERRLVASELTRRGYTARQIGVRLGVSWRTVQRYRQDAA